VARAAIGDRLAGEARAAEPAAGPLPARRLAWLTSVLGAALLAGIPIVFVTGLLSYAAYEPALGRNNLIGDPGFLDFYVFSWPTSPVWLYALTQGLHVTVGIALVPIVLVKLWSAMPKLFEWPPLRSPAHALERASLALLGQLDAVSVRHRDLQRPAVLPVEVLLPGRALLRRLGLHLRVRAARRDQGADDAPQPARAPAARRAASRPG